MSQIGKLNYSGEVGSLDNLEGEIKTLNFESIIVIEVVRHRSTNQDAPTHNVYTRRASGELFEIGVAWEKRIVRGPNEGDSFLSASIDDPSFPNPLSFAVFREEDCAIATWRRRQDRN